MNDEDLKKILADTGLNQNEALVYLALNELGSSTVTKIADKCKIHRTNIYDSLQKLIDRGLASYFVREDVKYFETTDPENLLKLIKLKEAEIINILPQLKLRSAMAAHEGTAMILKGTRAFMNILSAFLDYNQPIYAFGIPKSAPDMLRTQIPHFHKERLAKKVWMYHLYNFDAQERVNELKKMPLTDARYIDDQFKSEVSTNVCGDEVVLAFWTNPVFIVQIKNKSIADAYKHYFQLLWDSAVH